MNRFNFQQLDAFNGAGANGYGAKLNLKIGTGTTIKELYLKLHNLTVSQITQIKLDLNGVGIVEVSGSELHMLQKFKGEHSLNSVIVIPFTDHTQTLQRGQNMSELVTSRADTLMLYVNTAEATNRQANLVASIVPSVMYGIHREFRTYIPKIFNNTFNGGIVGVMAHRNLFDQSKNGNQVYLRRLHLNNVNVTAVETVDGGISTFDLDKDTNNYLLKRFGRIPQAGYYHFDPVFPGFAVADAMPLPTSGFEFKTKLSAVGDFRGIFETLEEIAPINARV